MTFSYLTDVPSAVEVDASNTELTYNGTAQAPSITVTDGDKTLAENTDYTVSGGDAINAGTYTATVTFQGNYSGTRTVPFTIAKAKITDLTVTMEGWHQGQTPNQPTINKTGVTATFTYRKNAESTYTSTVPTDPGTYYVMATVTETANYDAASAETNFTISAHQKTTVAAQAPGCETVGWDAYEYCSVEGCGYTTYVEQEALGHIEVKQNAQAPTCEEIGWNEYLTCERNCGYSTYVELPKRDHKDDNGDHRCDYEDCKAAMGAVTTVDTQTLTTASDKAAVYTATVNYSAGDITSLLLNDNEFFSLKDGVLKLCGSQVQGTYGVDTYTVKATVNSAQQLLMVEVRLSNGLVLRRGTYQLVSKNTTSYSVTAKAYDASDVSGIAISDQSITVEKYDIHDNASDVGLDDSLIADLSTTFSDARTTRNLAWTATATQMTFQYRVKGTTMWTEKAVTGSDNHFKADITGLQPDKTYEYQIVNGTEVSSIYEFTTAAAGNSGEFSFIAIGDTQGNEWAHTKYAEAAYAKALEKDANAKFILHTGDVVNDGGSDTQWSWFFKALDQNAANIPHFAAIGNHDMYDNGANFNEYFNHPNDGSTERLNSAYTGRIGDWVNNSDETFYSFDYGDAHFIVLHSGRYENGNVNTSDLDADMLNAQREWLIEDLSNNSHAKWTIVMVHQPSYHRLDEGAGADYSRPALADVFESYGVDLVIQGHSHLVTRTYPMVYDADTKTAGNVNTAAFIGGDPDRIARGEGTVYVTIGATTPFSRDSLGDLNMDHIMTIVTPFSTENYAANTAQASYTNVSVKNDKLTVTIRQLDGLVLDQFSIEGTYSGDDHTVITDAEVPATCTTPGKTAGSHCACGDILVAQTEIPAKGHAWTVSYDFADNGSACTATRICGNDASHNVSADAAITSAVTTPATCTVMGTTTYTATFTEDWAVTQTKAVQDVPTVAHTYGEPVFTWNGYECTATAKCTCGDELDVSVDVTFEVTTEATCNVEGIKTYTATAVVNDVTYTAAEHPTENIGMAANNHKNTETHAQDDATCTAVGYTAGEFCNDCQKWIEGHAEIPAINHKNQYAGEAKDATCTENGNTAGVYCPDCETWLTEQETIPAAHNLKYVAEVPATCVNAGNVAHYVCQVETCGKLFSDATGEEPIENVTLEATGNHTYGDDGKCTGCGADEPGQSTATIKAVSATLLYEDMIQVRYKFTVEANNAEVYGMYIFESKEDAETHDSTKAVQTKELVKYSDGYYGYTDGIAAKEMGDSQFVVGYLKLSDGTYIYGNVVEYSPKIYAQRMVDKDSTSAETKALCNALMHYGAAAQTYLKYKTDNLMNEGFAAVEYDASVLGESVFVVDTTETNGFTTKSANLLFEGAITYRIKYTAGSKIENKKLYLEYTVKGNTDSVELSYISDGYYGYISGIAAKDMDEALKAKPYYLDDSGNKVYGAELIYSGYEYSRRTISNSKDADSVALAKAFAMYVHAADIAIK